MSADSPSLPEPTVAEIRRLAEQLHLDLSDDAVADYRDAVAGGLSSFETVAERGDPYATDPPADREPGERVREPVAWVQRDGAVPDAEKPGGADPYNAWITRCRVEGSDEGPLAGLTVGIKDNAAVAGVEMTCGSAVVAGYVPSRDATVVTRLLEAGATVVGKTNMDDMAFTGNGHSGAFGPTLNPHDETRLAGGSSGGSAIAVATGEVDLALGADQGGSVRVPAAWTGVVGHKPTHGLVPYTGMVGIENTIDHAGPLAPDVESAATALDALAGRDPADPRQPAAVPDLDCAGALTGDPSAYSVAVLEEGFTRPETDERVNERVRDALKRLSAAGATVESVSLPLHDDATDVYTAALAEATLAAVEGEGVGHNWRGRYDVEWVEFFGEARRERGDAFPPSVKYTLLLGAYTKAAFTSRYYATAMNLRREMTAAYDALLAEYDLLAMPTTPQLPREYVPDQDRFEFLADAWGSLANTAPFNATGHPALSVPCGSVDGLRRFRASVRSRRRSEPAVGPALRHQLGVGVPVSGRDRGVAVAVPGRRIAAVPVQSAPSTPDHPRGLVPVGVDEQPTGAGRDLPVGRGLKQELSDRLLAVPLGPHPVSGPPEFPFALLALGDVPRVDHVVPLRCGVRRRDGLDPPVGPVGLQVPVLDGLDVVAVTGDDRLERRDHPLAVLGVEVLGDLFADQFRLVEPVEALDRRALVPDDARPVQQRQEVRRVQGDHVESCVRLQPRRDAAPGVPLLCHASS